MCGTSLPEEILTFSFGSKIEKRLEQGDGYSSFLGELRKDSPCPRVLGLQFLQLEAEFQKGDGPMCLQSWGANPRGSRKDSGVEIEISSNIDTMGKRVCHIWKRWGEVDENIGENLHMHNPFLGQKSFY